VKNRFQSLPFKCNLQRYNVWLQLSRMMGLPQGAPLEHVTVGLYNLHPVHLIHRA
jgi:hypothetical protein